VREHGVERRIGHANLAPFHVFRLVDRLIRGHMALAVIGQLDDLVAALRARAIRETFERVAVAAGVSVIEITEHLRRAAARRQHATCKQQLDASIHGLLLV
jgi:hypothetical protein